MGEFEDKLNSILSSPKDMERIMGLARELSGGTSTQDSRQITERNAAGTEIPGIPGDLDPKVISVITRIMGEYSKQGNDDKSTLINSMKPFLREERKAELDRAANVARLAKIARIAFSEFSGGDLHS